MLFQLIGPLSARHPKVLQSEGQSVPPEKIGLSAPVGGERDRLRRAAVGVRKAGLDLAKDDGVAVLRDDVRLAEGGAVVGL